MTIDPYDVQDDPPPALGTVLTDGRGSLPFALIHGEALVACAAWALGEAGVLPVDEGTPWEAVATTGEPFVVHDPLCPMTPPEFVAACVARALEHAGVVVGVRPVTDTVKVVADGVVGETVDRDALVSVASPVVLPPEVVADLEALPSHDLVELVAALRGRYPVELVEAPPAARRIGSEEDLRVLEALTAGDRPVDQPGPGPRGT
ncbi:2-C-methyl-D-erythritol 4-phosphate cytidylyltransferase [Nocardioides sp. T2.26MG-1]|uniref:2-C-methyl-D-erythritol 4-phosphate cytidylyltransferase n=1 Tax=Nocardioides sp. T2.26MG-1 TaxID=3041166 RepID=UPI002477C9D6|nr:2-C-methyl-D-erythritol 4-phosphate cytidylyltransferase [Nocardioides sp. T2.26MG-1]CAI9403661.1 2-C-methyl-D-erythritol 4-phosphate cytidylyltransferase [Nocardioides sp. T2.26MG-1]